MGLESDQQMMVLIYFLYFVLPILVGTGTGLAFGFLFPEVGRVRGVALGFAVGAIGIVGT